jgi:hypothetical protein
MSRLSLALVTLALMACETDLPGELVGAYNVSWDLGENSCGASALLLRDGHSRAIEVRQDEPRGYWRAGGVAPIQGRYTMREFRFATTSTFDLGSMDAGTAGCLVTRDEVLTGRIEDVPNDAGTRNDAAVDDIETTLRGEHAIGFTPRSDGRCANVQGPIGDFDRLPCRAVYSLQGLARKPID